MSWNNSDSAHEFRRSFPHPTDSLSFMRSSLSERLLSVSSRARHCENKYLIRVGYGIILHQNSKKSTPVRPPRATTSHDEPTGVLPLCDDV